MLVAEVVEFAGVRAVLAVAAALAVAATPTSGSEAASTPWLLEVAGGGGATRGLCECISDERAATYTSSSLRRRRRNSPSAIRRAAIAAAAASAAAATSDLLAIAASRRNPPSADAAQHGRQSQKTLRFRRHQRK